MLVAPFVVNPARWLERNTIDATELHLVPNIYRACAIARASSCGERICRSFVAASCNCLRSAVPRHGIHGRGRITCCSLPTALISLIHRFAARRVGALNLSDQYPRRSEAVSRGTSG